MAGRGRGAVLVLVLVLVLMMLLARAVATRRMLVDAGRACPAKPSSLAPLPLLYTPHSTFTTETTTAYLAHKGNKRGSLRYDSASLSHGEVL